jgi:hypothetical protein
MATTAHVAKAGHLVVMSEFLLRGYNVAMPEVDTGDDIFVVEDQEGQLWRIQVKTAIGKPMRNGCRAKFSIDTRQIYQKKKPDLFFLFAVRLERSWEYLLLARNELQTEHRNHGIGSASGDNVLITLRLTAQNAICSGRDWQAWRDNWSEWPEITT